MPRTPVLLVPLFLMGLALTSCETTPNEVSPPHEIATEAAPEAIGPYSQAILAGNTLYLAGQIALDPATGEMVGEGDIEAETHRVMQNLAAVLQAAGFDFGDVVQSQVFLVDLADFQAMNAVYGDYLEAPFPARATVQVAALPLDARVEIQLVAVQ